MNCVEISKKNSATLTSRPHSSPLPFASRLESRNPRRTRRGEKPSQSHVPVAHSKPRFSSGGRLPSISHRSSPLSRPRLLLSSPTAHPFLFFSPFIHSGASFSGSIWLSHIGDRRNPRRGIQGTKKESAREKMNSLFSGSWRRDADGDVQMTGNSSSSPAAGANLDKFFEDVEAIKDELKEVERIQRRLHESNEASKTLHAASAVRDLRARMDSDVATALKKAKLIKLRLESLDRANAANRSVPGCGPGTSTDRTRTSVVAGLRKKLKDSMESFGDLRKKVAAEYRETVERRYYTVTGEKADEETVDALVATGEGERFLQRAIQEQGRGKVLDVIAEIQERHGAASELERSLLELQQVFMDMSVLVASQGEQLDDIESQVGRAQSFVRRGTDQLQTARKHQKNTRKWTCIAILLLIIIILVIVLPIVLKK